MGVFLGTFDLTKTALNASITPTQPRRSPAVPKIFKRLDRKSNLSPMWSAGPRGLITAKKMYDSIIMRIQATIIIIIKA
jgi:hypothetical protein